MFKKKKKKKIFGHRSYQSPGSSDGQKIRPGHEISRTRMVETSAGRWKLLRIFPCPKRIRQGPPPHPTPKYRPPRARDRFQTNKICRWRGSNPGTRDMMLSIPKPKRLHDSTSRRCAPAREMFFFRAFVVSRAKKKNLWSSPVSIPRFKCWTEDTLYFF